MHDADFAITLMNRWDETVSGRWEPASALELLREGGLRFKRTRCAVDRDPSDADDSWELECLAFEDGSTALRLWRSRPDRDLTPWAAVAPLRRLQELINELDS